MTLLLLLLLLFSVDDTTLSFPCLSWCLHSEGWELVASEGC